MLLVNTPIHTNNTGTGNPSCSNVAVFLAVCTHWWTTLKAPDGGSNHCDWLFNCNHHRKEKQKIAYDNKGKRAHAGPFKDVDCERVSAMREWKTTLFTLISSVDCLCWGLPVSHKNLALHINDDLLLVRGMIVSQTSSDSVPLSVLVLREYTLRCELFHLALVYS